MWKSVVVLVLAVPLALVAGVIFGVAEGWKAGLIAGSATIGLCMVAATLIVFYTRQFSLYDVFLPTFFSVVWSLFLIPFSFGAEAFTAPAAIGAGLVLSLCLWKVHQNGGAGRKWLIYPIVVYIYEMLPINLPGIFDDYFAFGGDIVMAILMQFANLHQAQRQLPGE